jgi:XTP/dITP diphosphohydrolase/tetrapyrrole methylase family protein/MazG family protein/ATP diphosphatase
VSGPDGLAEALLDLQRLAERLRRDCPWDRAQTARTIVPHTVEEAYEVADAALGGDDEKLVDELGDLLFQTVFLALLLEERGTGSLEEVARAIHAKLVRRHPHVFAAAVEPDSAGEVKVRWEELKAVQEERSGIFHHVPEGLPALVLAKKVQRRAAAIGFEYESGADALTNLVDEVEELRRELPPEDPPPETEPERAVEAELGDVLFACVNVARRFNVDPELALRLASSRFRARVERAESLAAAEGHDFAELDVAEQDRYFDRAKEEE